LIGRRRKFGMAYHAYWAQVKVKCI